MMQDAYIIAGSRSAVGKATKGTLRDVRPDDLAAQVIRHLVASLPEFDPNLIHDVIVGNATPEAEQGLNLAAPKACRACRWAAGASCPTPGSPGKTPSGIGAWD